MKQIYLKLAYMVLCWMMSMSAMSEIVVSVNGFKYALYDTTASVCSYEGSSTNVIISETITYNDKTYSVTSIGNSAFDDCRGMTEVTIPNSVTSIGYWAFRGCTGLTEVTIPNSVTYIGSEAFKNCSGLTEVNFNATNCTEMGGGEYAHPVFTGCSSLTTINIGDNVETIPSSAFEGCTGLTEVTIPNSVTSIGSSAFEDCKRLTSITIGNSVTSIDWGAFRNAGLTSVTIPNSVIYIGRHAFEGCKSLTSITIGNSVTSISWSAFKNCSGLTEVTIPNSVTSIGGYAFEGCTGLTEVNFNATNCTEMGRSNYPVFKECSSITTINIGDNVETIPSYAFKGCTGLTSVTIPNSVTSIGDEAFYNTHLESVTIGSGVLTIGNNAFSYSTKVIWLTNTPPSGYTYAKGTVNYVANDLYTSLSNKTVYPFLSSIFEVDGVKYVPVSPSERTCDAIDCVYNETTTNIRISSSVIYKGVSMTVKSILPYTCYGNKYIHSITFDLQVTTIGSSAFSGCSSIPDISIPSSVTDIGNNTFSGCTSLSKVTIEDREEILSLGANVFKNCPLDEVYIGGNIAYPTSSDKGYSPFYRNTSLRTVVITDKETEISENEFYGCTNLKNVTIGDGVTTIGNWAFSGCASLDYFAFGSSLETIGKEAFSDCTSVTKIISRATTPPACGSQALDDINKWNCTLEVPQGTLSAYQAAEQWKEFFFIQEGDASTGISNTVVQPTPSAPTYHTLDGREVKNPGKGIYIVNGKKVVIK